MKKAQVNAFMSVLVIVFFLAFAMIGFVIYGSQQLRETELDVRQASEERAREITNVILAMPELRCSTNNQWERFCLDETKIKAFQEKRDDPYYRDILGFTFAMVIKPSDPLDDLSSATPAQIQSLQHRVIIDNPIAEGNIVTAEQTQTPITVFNPETNRYDYGILFVEVSSR